jgi:hypothetical protein
MVPPAYANVGVPMIFITLPGMLLALMPIIAIESKIYFRYFGLGKLKVIKYTTLTNSASTILGVPLAWLLHTILLLSFGQAYSLLFPTANIFTNGGLSLFLQVTLGAAWLGPIEGQLYWMIPAACLFLLIPYFFVSWYFEYFIMRKLVRNVEDKMCKSATLKANLVSYSFLVIVVIIWLTASIIEKKVSFIA